MLDGGSTEAGRPYFVMELVRGVPITEYCDQKALATRERLRLLIQVCQAVQHAHQKGIIHRDLKPGNVLVTLRDGEPVPVVIDFGVAKALGQNLTEMTLLTGAAQMIGTPAYMSPEQAELSGVDIDARSDIYSLGVLLYQLLTGVTPFDKDTLAQAALDEVRRMIRETEPPKPSTRLRTCGATLAEVARRRQIQPELLAGLVRGDLDWITMKCLEKDRGRRYASASLLALDITHYLQHEPVLASPPSKLYRARKFTRRNRTSVVAAVVVMCALMLGTAGALMGLAKASRERNRAQTILRQMDFKHTQGLFETDRAAEGLASLAMLVREKPDDLPVVEWLLNELTQRSFPLPLLEPIQLDDSGVCARFSPDGSSHADWVNFVEFSPSGDRILTGSDDKTAQVWEVAPGARMGQPLRHSDEVKYGEFSPDGERVVTASSDWTARVWNARTGEPLTPPCKHEATVCNARFSPDGGRVVTASFDKTARLWDGFSGAPLGKPMPHKAVVRSARFSPDGQRVVTASEDGTARIWDAITGQPLSEPMIHHGYVWSAEFDRAGNRVLTASADATAQVWDARPGQALHHSAWAPRSLPDARWSPDGRKVIIESFLRDATTLGLLPSPYHYSDDYWPSIFARFSPDAKSFLTGSGDGTARVWPTGSEHMRTRPLHHQGRVHDAEFSADNAWVVTALGRWHCPSVECGNLIDLTSFYSDVLGHSRRPDFYGIGLGGLPQGTFSTPPRCPKMTG
jgi:eukaryotic-like serine/threonine-protein kinase